ncbi:hypothetical protein SALBM135S_06520 [Streptomyces alboniger]
MCVRTVCGEEEALGDGLPAEARHHAAQDLALARGQRLHEALGLGAVLRAAVSSRRTPVSSAGGRWVLVAQHTADDGEQA